MRSVDDYLTTLEGILERLQPVMDSCELVGSGDASFVVATKGRRGFEIYWSGDGGFVIDRVLDDDLFGEATFESLSEALAAGVAWVEKGVPP